MNIGSSNYSSLLQRQLSQLQNAQSQAQQRVSTGRKFVQASEDPAAAFATQRISLQRLELSADGQRRDFGMRLNETATLSAEQTRKLLAEASQAIELAFEAPKDSPERENLGEQIDRSIEQAVSFLNFELEGRYLFGGTETAHPPFGIVRDAEGSIASVEYRGNTESLEFKVGLGIRMDPAATAEGNPVWAEWMNALVAAKDAFVADDKTASREALNVASEASDDAFSATSDLISKSIRLQTLEDWSRQSDASMANREAGLQEVDMNEAVLQFNNLQRSYQASLQSGSLLLGLSLVDFL